ncbi:MAG TPA: glucosamine-6-phosphate deaminase [Caldithrix abyssi]|uniref:Glucosamine-6-phosphate deaminase n=1 Tax=Caldithrix abyssi TaxID=187145 RepID=A0A7V5PSB6_CALAY|nr:glucosamine-6-phosphate deaminase [Caldithrix abyssi]
MVRKANKPRVSRVEQIILEKTNRKLIYPPIEKIGTIVVNNFPTLGLLTAMRFLEWAQQNEGWTISLPTGKTPEHFIKWVTYLLNNWNEKKARSLLEEYGVDPGHKPDMRSFHFIQIDEFYPINSYQHNSFYYYVKKFYIQGFGLDERKALLINPNEIGIRPPDTLDEVWPDHIVDLSLRTRYPKNASEEKQKQVLDAVDQFCTEYETKIRALGGIGFFLGGIGPDGHIGFNVRGSDHYSTTRLTPTNYETQAAAATDLGGIEISRNRLVITIGLQTIVHNPNTTAVIIAAGEAKAKVIKDAIQSEKTNQVPASALQVLPNARFIITQGAAKLLTERRYLHLKETDPLSIEDKFQIVTDLALEKKKRLSDLTKSDFRAIRSSKLLLEREGDNWKAFLEQVEKEYIDRITRTLKIPKNTVFLHTAPHHDDIMLGYLPYLVRLMREGSNRHFFNYLTSGFTAVTNKYMLRQLENAERFLKRPEFQQLLRENYFDPHTIAFRNRDVFQYLDGVAANSQEDMDEGNARRLLRNLVEIFEDDSFDNLKNRIAELKNYFMTQYAGKKDLTYIQQLKGMTREWEADILWGYFGFTCESVIHSRLGFYKGDIFTEEPTIDRDVKPVLETIRRTKPDVITVAFDPEGSGPDTHYKVLQAVSTALKLYQQETGRNDIQVWGYRNVWYRFHPSEATHFVPVTHNTRAILDHAFMNAFGSQREASFPSYEYDGPFSGLAQKIQVNQYQMMKCLLGRDFFYQNPDSRIRSTRGFVFLKIMDLEEFYERSIQLRKSTENL